jgi:hypothetical protein
MNASGTQISRNGDNQAADTIITIDVPAGITIAVMTNTNPPSVGSQVLAQQLMTLAKAHT